MASIDLLIASPIALAMSGAIMYLARKRDGDKEAHAVALETAHKEAGVLIDSIRAEAREERKTCAAEIIRLQGIIAEERECRDETVTELHRQILVITELRRTDQIAAAAAIERLIARLDAMGAFRGEDVP